MSSNGTFTGRKLELLQTLEPQYEAAKATKQYKEFWLSLFSEFSTQFPLIEELFPGKTLAALSVDESEQYTAALAKQKAKLKEWFRWRANPRSRNSNNSVTGKDLKRIYGVRNTREAKAYEVFAELFPEVIKPAYDQACIDQGATGRAKLPIWHNVVSGLWANATEEQRLAVSAKVAKPTTEATDVIEKIVESSEDTTPQAYQRFQNVLPGILQSVLEPAVRKAGMMAVVTLVGPIPKLGGRIQTTSLQFGDNQETPLFSEEWVGHDKHFVEALASFARKHVFYELCSSRSLLTDSGNTEDGEELDGERSGTTPKIAGDIPATEEGGKAPATGDAQKEKEEAVEPVGQAPEELPASQSGPPKDNASPDVLPASTPPTTFPLERAQGTSMLPLQPPVNPFSVAPQTSGAGSVAVNSSLPGVSVDSGFVFGRPVPIPPSTAFGLATTTPQSTEFGLGITPLPVDQALFTQRPNQTHDPIITPRDGEITGPSLRLRSPSPSHHANLAPPGGWGAYSMTQLLNGEYPWDDLETMGRVGTEHDVLDSAGSDQWDDGYVSSMRFLQMAPQVPNPSHHTLNIPVGEPQYPQITSAALVPDTPQRHDESPFINREAGSSGELDPRGAPLVPIAPAPTPQAAPVTQALTSFAAQNNIHTNTPLANALDVVFPAAQPPCFPPLPALPPPPNVANAPPAPVPPPSIPPPVNVPPPSPPKSVIPLPKPLSRGSLPSNTAPPAPPASEPPKKPLVLENTDTDINQGSARRSARASIPSKRAENLNRIGTNTLMHAPVVTPSQEDTGPPEWFTAAYDFLTLDAGLGADWTALVELWAQLERAMGYGKVGKGALPVQNRPEEWKQWTAKSSRGGRGGRAYNDPPFILEPAEFGLAFSKWWSAVQPPFRASDTPFPKQVWADPSEKGDSWASIRKSGPNGFVSVVTMMKWWGAEAKKLNEFKTDSRAEWTYLVSDIGFCVEEMLRSVPQVGLKRKRDVSDISEKENKRQG